MRIKRLQNKLRKRRQYIALVLGQRGDGKEATKFGQS